MGIQILRISENGLVAGIKDNVYKQIYDELKAFIVGNKMQCEDGGKGTFKLRAESDNTKNYLAGIKQMISQFMAVCIMRAKIKILKEKKETIILGTGTILYKFNDKAGVEKFVRYSTLYKNLISSLRELLRKSEINNLILLDEPLTYQGVLKVMIMLIS